MTLPQISFTDWSSKKREGDILIDVRSPAEFRRQHVPDSVNLPLTDCQPDRLNQILKGEGFKPGSRVCLICHSGTRSNMAARQLQAWKGGELVLMERGVGSLSKEHLNTQSKGVISIDRQVRIVAGGLILCGLLGSQFIHVGFEWLSAFIGAGLIFAGVTDKCAMAKVLERMPWNQSA